MAKDIIKKYVIQEHVTAMENMLGAEFQNLTEDQGRILRAIVNDYLIATYCKAALVPVLTDHIHISKDVVYMDFENAQNRPSSALPASAGVICFYDNIVTLKAKHPRKCEEVTP